MRFVASKREVLPQDLYRAAYGCKRVSYFVGYGGGEFPQGLKPVVAANHFFKSFKPREILKYDYARHVPAFAGRNHEADRNILAFFRPECLFASRHVVGNPRSPAHAPAYRPPGQALHERLEDTRKYLVRVLIIHVFQDMTRNAGCGAVEARYPPFFVQSHYAARYVVYYEAI